VKHLVERPLGGDAGPARIASGTEMGLSEALQRDGSGPLGVRNEAKQCQRGNWPTVGCAAGRFGHDEVSVGGQQRRRAFGRHGWRAEAAGHDQICLASTLCLSAGVFCPLTEDLHPIGELQSTDGVTQKGCSPDAGVNQGPVRLSPYHGQHQAGNSTSAAEVNRPPRGSGQYGREGQAVLDVSADRARPEESPGLGFAEHIAEPVPARNGECEVVGQRADGRMMTRLLGSSPSEVVVTPSMAFTVSWTILRSAALMGSRTFRVPRLCTSSAS